MYNLHTGNPQDAEQVLLIIINFLYIVYEHM